MRICSPKLLRVGALALTFFVASPVLAQTAADLVNRSLTVFNGLCGSGTEAILDDTSCDIAGGLGGGAEQAQTALLVSPREATAASTTATQTTTAQVNAERTRLDAARHEPITGADAAKGARFGGFLNGSGGFGEVDAQAEAQGYDVVGGGATAGIDYRFAHNVVAGIGFGWNQQNTEFDDELDAEFGTSSVGGGEIDSNSYSPSLYGSWFSGPFHVDGILTYTYVDYEFEREVDLINTGLQNQFSATAKGDTDAHQFGTSIAGGYTFDVGALSVGPTAQFSYLLTSIDGYTESGVPGVPLKYDDQTIRSVLTSVGAEAAYAISTPLGVIVPNVRGSWEHEFENDARSIDAQLVLNTTNQDDMLFTRTAKPDRDYARVGGGVSAQLQGGFAVFVDYDGVFGLDDTDYHRFTGGGRVEF